MTKNEKITKHDYLYNNISRSCQNKSDFYFIKTRNMIIQAVEDKKDEEMFFYLKVFVIDMFLKNYMKNALFL